MKKFIDLYKTQLIEMISAMAILFSHLFGISGTTKIKNLDENIGSLMMKLTKEDMKEILNFVPIEEVAGDRTYGGMLKVTWKFTNTPPKDCKA